MTRKRDGLDIDNLVNDYQSGLTLAEVARKHGVGVSSVSRALAVRNVIARPKTTIDELAVVAAYVGGASENGVGAQFGVSRNVIARILAKNGVRRRNASEAEALKWSGMSAEARRVQVAAAHKAAKGRSHSMEEKVKRARTVMAKKLHTSEAELKLADMLTARGIGTVQQEAIGPYNCDLGAFPVAVEVFGGSWHWHGPHMLRTSERFHYILNAGWHILVVKIDSKGPLTDATADYVAAFVEQARSDPSARREYRVVRGAGEVLATGSADDDEITIISTLTRGRNARGQYARVPR